MYVKFEFHVFQIKYARVTGGDVFLLFYQFLQKINFGLFNFYEFVAAVSVGMEVERLKNVLCAHKSYLSAIEQSQL